MRLKNSKILFISDLHLSEDFPEITKKFLYLLNIIDSSVSAVYILGDLFDVWIGDYTNLFYQQIKSALQSVIARGVNIYFLTGNRDFLLGKKFAAETGCVFLPEIKKIDLYGQPALIMHGDTLCTKDIVYQKARKKTHNKFLQISFLALPLFIRKKMAEKLRFKSKLHTRSVALDIMDVTVSEVEKMLLQYEAEFLIHGHTHKPGFHQHTVNGITMQRIVLGAWHGNGSVLVWHDTGRKSLIEF